MGRIRVDTSEPDVAIVILEGEHELFNATKLQRRLESLIDEDIAVVIDLTSATFLDSSIVSVLLRARDRARRSGSRYAVVMDDSTGDSVRRMFEITGLSRFLPIVGSRAAALTRSV